MSCCCKVSETVVKVSNVDLENLPVRSRKCQDIPFIFVFIIFLIGLIAGICVAIDEGDIDRIIKGVDSYGNICGRKNTEAVKGILPQHAPKDYTDMKKIRAGDRLGASAVVECVKACQPKEIEFLNRCIPVGIRSEEGQSNILSITSSKTTTFIKEAAGDIQFSWEEILYLCIGATLLTLLIIILLRFAAKVIIYSSMVIMLIVSTAVIGYIWYKYYVFTQNKNNKQPQMMSSTMRVRQSSERNWLIGGVLATILWLFFLLMMWVMRKRIALVVALFEESGKALIAIPFLMFQPFWTFLWLALILCLWVYAIMWIQSAGKFVVQDRGADVRAYLEHETGMQVIKWYYVFGLLWLTWFCFGCQNMVIAYAVVKWFFTRDKSKLRSPILEGIRITTRYHLGSIAVGSFIISLIRFIRLALQFLERNMANSRNPNTVCLLSIIQCCVKCFESCIKYLTRNAYIEIAIYGFNFCNAAKKAYQVITSNAMNIAAINSVGDFALFLCKASVVVVIAGIGVGVLGNKDGITHKWIPIVMACFFSYLIADCFLSVYEMCIDTTFLCFCEDFELNDGINRPYFMSSTLMRFVENTHDSINYMPDPKPEPAA